MGNAPLKPGQQARAHGWRGHTVLLHGYSCLSATPPYACTQAKTQTALLQATPSLSLAVGYNSGYTRSMKTAISIPDEVFGAAEELSRRLGMSRSELYSQAVAAFIASHRSTGVREKLDAVYGEEDSTLDPVLAHLQALALPREDW